MYLKTLKRIQKIICNVIAPDLASRFQPLSHRCNLVSMCRFKCHDNCSAEHFSLLSQLLEFKRSSRLDSRPYHFTVEIANYKDEFFFFSFHSFTVRLPLCKAPGPFEVEGYSTRQFTRIREKDNG